MTEAHVTGVLEESEGKPVLLKLDNSLYLWTTRSTSSSTSLFTPKPSLKFARLTIKMIRAP